jgi:hypothetical protein
MILRKPLLAISVLVFASGAVAGAAEPHYQPVENWAQFPSEVTKWGAATGVDVDSHDDVYVFHRNDSMPIMVFDNHGKFLRAWGQGMFKTTHFLRVDRSGYVWITDRGNMQAFKFSSTGKLLLTLGRKGITGDNTSHDAFNGMADLAVAKNGDIFIADGEGPTRESRNSPAAACSLNGGAVKAPAPASSTCLTASRLIPGAASTSPIAPITVSRSSTRTANF